MTSCCSAVSNPSDTEDILPHGPLTSFFQSFQPHFMVCISGVCSAVASLVWSFSHLITGGCIRGEMVTMVTPVTVQR